MYQLCILALHVLHGTGAMYHMYREHCTSGVHASVLDVYFVGTCIILTYVLGLCVLCVYMYQPNTWTTWVHVSALHMNYGCMYQSHVLRVYIYHPYVYTTHMYHYYIMYFVWVSVLSIYLLRGYMYQPYILTTWVHVSVLHIVHGNMYQP